MSRRKEDFGDKVKAHTSYIAADGEFLPGSTTILGVLAKPFLVGWANKLGRQGIDSYKFTEEAAAIGNLAHYLVECDLKKKTPDLKDYTPAQIERATFSYENFKAWRREHDLRPILIEGQLVSDEYRYGGTVDFYGYVDGALTLIDFKTSAAVYLEHRAQAVSYGKLLIDSGHPVKKIIVIRLGRGADDTLESHEIGQGEIPKLWRLFRACLDVYYIQRELKS